ncbi:hypothetical protein Tco_1391176 [Tanacetum coccineum]
MFKNFIVSSIRKITSLEGSERWRARSRIIRSEVDVGIEHFLENFIVLLESFFFTSTCPFTSTRLTDSKDIDWREAFSLLPLKYKARRRENLWSLLENTASGGVAFTSNLSWLAMVVASMRPRARNTPGAGGTGAWRKTGRSNLVGGPFGASVNGIPLVVVTAAACDHIFLDIVTINVAIGGWGQFLIVALVSQVAQSQHEDEETQNQGEENPPRIEPLINLSGQPTHPLKELVFATEVSVGRHVKEGKPSWNAAIYFCGWNIPRRCRVDTPEWCLELMTHLTPPAAQEESNALTNEVALQRAWFNVARGAMAQTDMLERFENILADYDNLAEAHAECSEMVQKLVTTRQDLEHNVRLYTDAINRLKTVREEHAGCGQRINFLEKETNYLSSTNHDQAARIVSLVAKLAKKDSALTYSERLLAEGARELVGRLLKSHEYKESISGPFNMAIQAGWGKDLSEGHTDEEIMDDLSRKIARGYRHSVADLLKVYSDPAPSQGTSNPNTSKAFGRSDPPHPKKT